ncbi:uncharacterized protein LOC111333463 [Stylophora pistillata]|uniref:Cyclic GMP-binding protein C n=1 Tax=Stylophora pistillata TaxID=50429 RepID=A0A2B4RX40_STYPI|nr:uncharacterized protein LOC111333463 [Stylophora pistillata]XP_022794762.1 uncharacterized protein LOC111333463 [Stylophora pistillata]PFX23024.1 Cyclic GMP-binding protein C [Stylophora pistillata]
MFNREKHFYENFEVNKAQGGTTNTEFAFPRQCLVLGDPRVGKTSLVKSLTGKPFDPTEKTTQGIDQSLVDHKWKTCDMKDLVFGDLWRYLKTGDVELALIGTGRQVNKVLLQDLDIEMATSLLRLLNYFVALFLTCLFLLGTVMKFSVELFLIYYIYYGHRIFSTFALNFETSTYLRFILASLAFTLNRSGLLIGLYSAILICPFYDSYFDFASTREFIMLSTVTGIAFLAIFLFIGPLRLPFGLDQLARNQAFIKLLRYCRLPLSISTGLILGFIVSMSLGESPVRNANEKALLSPLRVSEIPTTKIPLCKMKCRIAFLYLLNWNNDHGAVFLSLLASFVMEFPTTIWNKKYFQTKFLAAMKVDITLAPLVALCFILFYYYFRIVFQVWTKPFLTLFYFLILFFVHICLTLHQEWFCSDSESNDTIFVHPPNSFLTVALIGKGEINVNRLQNALNAKYPSLKVKVLDFAGDKEYYAYHHMFLRSQAVYLIVFKMTDFAQDDLNYFDAERLCFWFESVCSHVLPKTPIFLVGTHSKTIDKKRIQVLNNYFKQTFWGSYCDELIVNEDDDLIFFPVENSKGENDLGIQKLRIKIMAAAEECKPTTDQKVPLSWIRIQDAIIQLRQKKAARFCVTLKEFPWAFGNNIHTDWSEETLKYFHEQGLVIYIYKDEDLSNWVLLKPQLLVDIIIQLVKPSPQVTQLRGLRSDWKLLQEKGVLTKQLLVTIISNAQENEVAIRAFLEEYDLICPLTNTKVKIASLRDKERLQPSHFVPSLLPRSQDGCIPAWHDDMRDKKFLVFFERFLPEPLFHRLLSRAHKNSKVEFVNGATVVFRDVGKFWMSPWQPYRLKLIKKESVIEVTFSTSNGRGKKPSDVLCQVYTMVDGICKRSFPFVKFHCGPACPSAKCPGYQDNYMYTPYHHYRQHVFNIMPGRQVDKTASLYCVNRSFEDELQEWIP